MSMIILSSYHQQAVTAREIFLYERFGNMLATLVFSNSMFLDVFETIFTYQKHFQARERFPPPKIENGDNLSRPEDP